MTDLVRSLNNYSTCHHYFNDMTIFYYQAAEHALTHLRQRLEDERCDGSRPVVLVGTCTVLHCVCFRLTDCADLCRFGRSDEL